MQSPFWRRNAWSPSALDHSDIPIGPLPSTSWFPSGPAMNGVAVESHTSAAAALVDDASGSFETDGDGEAQAVSARIPNPQQQAAKHWSAD